MKKILPALLIAIAVCAAYAPAIRDGFVWDDIALLLRDPLIRSPRLIPEGFQHFLFTDATASDFYRPMQRLSYTMEYWAFGAQPAPYHAISILCHVAAALALFLTAGELLKAFGVAERMRRIAAFCATLVWAIHPLHSSAVIYVSGRADPLAAAFGFAGFYCGLRSECATGGKRWLLTLAAGALIFGSVLSKESGLVFPALWAATLLLQRKWKPAATAAAVGLAVVFIYASMRLPAEHIPPPVMHTPTPLLVRPILVARAVAEYAGLIVLPQNLYMDRDVATHPTGFSDASVTGAAWRELQTLAGIILMAAFVLWMLRARRHDRAVFACLILTAMTYLPISGLIVLNATVAEHWIYLPSAFLFLAASAAITQRLSVAKEREEVRFRFAAAALIICVVCLSARTFFRAADWKDQRTFFEKTISDGGDSARMRINLATVDSNDGRLDAAKQRLQQALATEPGQPLAVLNLAAVALKQNDFKTAHELLARAVEMPLVDAQAHEMIAVLAFKEKGQVDLLRLRLASRTGPPQWAIEKRYIKVLAESGDVNRAIAELQTCLQTQWYRSESWELLGELLAKTNHKAETARAYAQAEAYDVHIAARPKVL
ncbi:MAG: tetratricopeptide repeat protein [Chthoniobacterales bacterium]